LIAAELVKSHFFLCHDRSGTRPCEIYLSATAAKLTSSKGRSVTGSPHSLSAEFQISIASIVCLDLYFHPVNFVSPSFRLFYARLASADVCIDYISSRYLRWIFLPMIRCFTRCTPSRTTSGLLACFDTCTHAHIRCSSGSVWWQLPELRDPVYITRMQFLLAGLCGNDAICESVNTSQSPDHR
jgi:hypothetical protein